MLSHTDGDAEFVEQLADVVRMQRPAVGAGQDERDGPTPVDRVRWPDDPQPGYGGQLFEGVGGDVVLVRGDGVHAEIGQVVDGGAETNRLGDHRRAGLEPVRRVGVGRRLHRHELDHLAAAEERRHGRQQFAATPQHADTGRPAHLVAGEGEEVHVEGDHVDRHVRHGLGAVEDDERADLAGPGDQRRDRVDRAENVRLVHERDQLRPLVDHLVEVGKVEAAVVGDADPAQRRPGPPAQHLPRHQVGVVLHLGDGYLVAGPEPEPLRLRARRRRVAHRVGDEVQRLGGVLGEDDLVTPGGANERRELVPGVLVQRGGLLGKRVDAAVDVGVVQLVVVPLGVEDAGGLLRARRAVEVDQRPVVVHPPRQDREVLADPLDVVPGPRPAHPGEEGRRPAAGPRVGLRIGHRHAAVPAGSVVFTYRS